MSLAGYLLNLHINSPQISPMRRLAALFMMVVFASPAVFSAAEMRTTSTTSFEYNNPGRAQQLRWTNTTIKVALSRSLATPGANIRLGSDVLGAARRALSRWSAISDIVFEVFESDLQSISPARGGDGISLITVADTVANNTIFNGNATAGRTRVFFDEETGEISEADIVINPHATSADGLPVQFSTDGTRGTYDLESTFAHEIGHLLGLDHSSIISSTMHPHQALNGVYGKPAFTERTPSEEDRFRIKRLYDSTFGVGVSEGLIEKLNTLGNRTPLNQAEVWVEETTTGRVIGAAQTSAKASMRLDKLSASFRIFGRNMAVGGEEPNHEIRNGGLRSVESSASLLVTNRFLNPRLIGMGGDLSTTPVPVEPGTTLKLYVAGEGLDQLSPNGVSITSPFFKVDASSIHKENFSVLYPVISFEITTAANVPFGDYSIRLQSKTSEIAFVPGALTVDPGVETNFASPSDDPRFFVRQHYRDFLGREADSAGLDYWANQLEQCGEDEACLSARRVKLAAAFVSQPEFQEKGAFVHRIYRAVFGRMPTFSEFEVARELLAGQELTIADTKRAVAQSLIESREFQEKYPHSLTAEAFIDQLSSGIHDVLGINFSSRRGELLAMLKKSQDGREEVIATVADDAELMEVERDRAFVLTQFFGYWQRDADEGDFKYWLDVLNTKGKNDPGRFTAVTCSFVNSFEYQFRFGMVPTHTPNECLTN